MTHAALLAEVFAAFAAERARGTVAARRAPSTADEDLNAGGVARARGPGRSAPAQGLV